MSATACPGLRRPGHEAPSTRRTGARAPAQRRPRGTPPAAAPPPAATLTLRPRGELDIATAAQLRDDLAAAADTPAGRIVVDLTDVTFLDATILGVLAATAARLHAAGRRLEVANAAQFPARLLTLTQLGDVLICQPARGPATA